MKKVPRKSEKDVAAALAKQRGLFLSFIAARVGSRAEAEDVLQAAFIKALKASRTLKTEGKITAWFYRILRNALTDHWRRKATEGRALSVYGTEALRRAGRAEAELDRRVCACVKDLVGTIRPEYADAVRAVDLESSSVREFARRAGVTENSASVRLHRARQSLKKRLIATCGACAEHECRDCDCGQV